MAQKKEGVDWTLTRTPIVLGEHTIALITLFHLPHDHLEDIWLMDYLDHIKNVDHAASQFIDQLEDRWSPRFLMALRDKITATLAKHDSQYGTAFAAKVKTP